MPVANLPFTYVVKGRYWRFRKGKLHTALPGAPGDAAFHEKYSELLRLANAEPEKPAETSLAALIIKYKASAEFAALRPRTRDDYEQTLDLIKADDLGAQPYRLITQAMVKAVRDEHAATPRKAHKIKQMVSRLYSWAAEESLVRAGHNPAAGFKRLKVRQKTITPWSDYEIALFHSAAPKHMRLVLDLLLYTGQRVKDVAEMDWSAFQGDYIRVRQSKTGEPMDIACHPKLRATLEANKTAFRGRIIRNAKGRPYNANALGKAIHDQCAKVEAMPPDRSPHGLRYAAAGCLEEAGATVSQISAVLGHRTYQMAMKYLTARRESAAGMAKFEQTA